MKVTKHSTKLFLICRFFNFFCFDKVTCDVNERLPGNCVRQRLDVMSFPKKSKPPPTASVLCLWLLVIHSGWTCWWWAFFRHFYSFLKWNRIIGDSRVGQDNRRSQIALQSKFKSSFAWRASSNAPIFFFCLVLALKSPHPPPENLSYRAWCCHHLLDLTSSPSLPADHPDTNTHAHTHTRLGMSGTIPQALLSPWHRPEPLGFSVMATTIFRQHRALSSPSPDCLHAEIRAQSIPPLLLNKELNPAPKQIKGALWAAFAMARKTKKNFIRVLKCSAFWQVESTDLFNFGKMFPEMMSWQGGRGG